MSEETEFKFNTVGEYNAFRLAASNDPKREVLHHAGLTSGVLACTDGRRLHAFILGRHTQYKDNASLVLDLPGIKKGFDYAAPDKALEVPGAFPNARQVIPVTNHVKLSLLDFHVQELLDILGSFKDTKAIEWRVLLTNTGIRVVGKNDAARKDYDIEGDAFTWPDGPDGPIAIRAFAGQEEQVLFKLSFFRDLLQFFRGQHVYLELEDALSPLRVSDSASPDFNGGARSKVAVLMPLRSA